MKRRLKRIFAVILAMIIMLSADVLPATADETDNVSIVQSTIEGTDIIAEAQISEGTFDNENSDITMKINLLGDAELEAAKLLIEDQLTQNGEGKQLKDMSAFQVTWYANGEQIVPSKKIPLVLKNTRFPVGDNVANTTVFHIVNDTGVYSENVNQNELEKFFEDNGIDDSQMNEYETSKIKLAEDGTADEITVEVGTDNIYGFYTSSVVEEDVSDEEKSNMEDAVTVQSDDEISTQSIGTENTEGTVNVKIEANPDQDSFKAGDTIQFTVTVSKKDRDLDNWNIIPSLSPELGTIEGGDLNDKLTKIDNKNQSVSVTYTVILNQDIDTEQTIAFTADVKKGTEKNKQWNWTDQVATATASFQVSPLSGVFIQSGSDYDSNINDGILGAEFVLQNNGDATNYTSSIIVKKGDEVLVEGSDYSLDWITPFSGSLEENANEVGRVKVNLIESPFPGNSYQVELNVVDNNNNESNKAVTFVKPESNLSITVDRTGPYLAGETVTFTVRYDATEELAKNKWQIVPDIDNAAIKEANSDVLEAEVQTQKLKQGFYEEFSYAITIPEDIDTNDIIHFTAKIQTRKDKNNPFLDLSGAADSYAFRVTALNGVKVTDGRDIGSNVGTKTLVLEYDLKNYGEENAKYSYAIEVKSDGKVIPAEDYDLTWLEQLPDEDTTDGDVLTIAGKGEKTAKVQIILHENTSYMVPFDITLSVTAVDTGETSSKTVHVEGAELADIIPSGLLNNGGLDLLYYGNVERDSKAPFHNAAELQALLTTSSDTVAKEIWERYRYDLYDPNCFLGDETCNKLDGKNRGYDYGDYGTLNKGKYTNDYPRFEDDLLAYPKDLSHTPFHQLVKGEINPLNYSIEDGGIAFENYFTKLEKTAGPDEGEDNKERKYTVELSTETNPTPVTPRLYVIQIQTSWQMFDLAHANATKTNYKEYTKDGTEQMGMAVGSCSNNTSMANLYDIKNALIRFAEYLKEYDDGSTMLAISNVQHTNTNSMIDSTKGIYFSNDMDNILNGLINWDTFADCEHVHYTSDALDNAISNIDYINENWTDKTGTKIKSEAEKTAIIIGGATENTEGTSGYGIPLNKTNVSNSNNTRNSNLDHVYGIRTNVGTNVDGKKNTDGNDIISWLDIDDNQQLFKQEGNDFYVAPSEDDVYNSLMDIFQRSNTDQSKYDQSAIVDDVVITDTIQKEFSVTNVKAYYEENDGTLTELSEDEYTVQNTINDDQSTKVDVTYKTVKGKKKLVVKIDTQAKEDYLGSNNVYTNVNREEDPDSGIEGVGPEISSYKHTFKSSGKTTVYDNGVAFKETPQVNVPLEFEVTDGLTVTKALGVQVDLKDIAYKDETLKDKMTKDIEDLIDNYPQTSGTLTYQWIDANGNPLVDTEGNPLGKSDFIISNGASDKTITIPSYIYTTQEGDEDVKFTLQVTFTPEEIEAGNLNKNPVLEKTDTGDVHINVIPATVNGVLQISKQNTKGETLGGIEFALYKATIGDDDTWSKENDTAYKTGTSSGDATTKGDLIIEDIEPGNYLLYETKAQEGYRLPSNPWRVVVTANGITQLTTINGDVVDNVEDCKDQYLILNYESYTLPNSGGIGTYLFTISGVAIMMTALLLYISKRRKRRGDIGIMK